MKLKKLIAFILSIQIVFLTLFTNTSQADTNNNYTPSSSVISQNYMYYTKYSRIYKINTETKKKICIKNIQDTKYIEDLTVKNGWIYCTILKPVEDDYTYYPYIYKIRTNGKDGKILKSGCNPVIYNDNIYYIKTKFDEYSGEIYRMSLSGKNNTLIKKQNAKQFIIYKSNIYYVYYSYNTSKYYLKKTSLSGKNNKTLLSSKRIIGNLHSYSDYIYFNLNDFNSTGDIYKIKTTSTSKIKLISNAWLEDLSGGYIYYTIEKNDYDYIYKMKLSSKYKTFITKYSNISDVIVCGNYMIVKDYTITYDPDNQDIIDTFSYLHFMTTNGKNIIQL